MCNYIVQRIEQFVITLYFKRNVGYNFQIKINETILRVPFNTEHYLWKINPI